MRCQREPKWELLRTSAEVRPVLMAVPRERCSPRDRVPQIRGLKKHHPRRTSTLSNQEGRERERQRERDKEGKNITNKRCHLQIHSSHLFQFSLTGKHLLHIKVLLFDYKHLLMLIGVLGLNEFERSTWPVDSCVRQ